MGRVGELRSAIEAEAVVDPYLLEPDALGERLREMLRCRDQLDAIVARTVAGHDQRSAWRADGASSEKDWLASHARMTRGQAGAMADTARRLAQLPQTLTALADG